MTVFTTWRRAVGTMGLLLMLGTAATAAAPGLVTVHRGDTLSALARAHHTTVPELRRLNGMTGTMIYAGRSLRVPADPGRAAALPVHRQYPPAVLASAARHRSALARSRQPSPDYLRARIAGLARSVGVDPALALAVAWQESGFQQRVVSDADAVGVMQVLPSTASWLSQAYGGRRLDVLTADGNVTAGVLLLRQLTTAAPVDQAVAGYYQGLGSVRAQGMLPDTRDYVANVLRLRSGFARGR